MRLQKIKKEGEGTKARNGERKQARFVIARNEAIQDWRVCRRFSSGLLHCVRNDGRRRGFATLSPVPCSLHPNND
jgi:hypothetical protein